MTLKKVRKVTRVKSPYLGPREIASFRSVFASSQPEFERTMCEKFGECGFHIFMSDDVRISRLATQDALRTIESVVIDLVERIIKDTLKERKLGRRTLGGR
jgi:hypothetical protein